MVYLLCALHLEQNNFDYLTKKASKEVATNATRAIFHKDGIVCSKSHENYENLFAKFFLEFGEYYDDERLEALYQNLWEYIVEPALNFPHLKVPGPGSTNRVEAVHGATKKLLQHKPVPIHQLGKVCSDRMAGRVSCSLINVEIPR